MKLVFFVLSVLCEKFVLSITLPSSPCPDIFSYESDGFRYYGVVRAPNPPPYGSKMSIKITMSLPAHLPNNYVGKVELYESRAATMQRIIDGLPVKYRIYFPLTSPIPQMTKLLFSDRFICSGPPARGIVVTSINLEHTLRSEEVASTSGSNLDMTYVRPQSQKPIFEVQSQSPYLLPEISITSDRPMQFNPNIPNQEIYQNFASTIQPSLVTITNYDVTPLAQYQNRFQNFPDCGTVSGEQIALIIKGETTGRKDWPWMVAIFKKKLGSLAFICGGSLISKRLIITAAHCVTDNNRRTNRPDDYLIRLGVYNVDDWTDEHSVTKTLSNIFLNHFFEGYPFANDISVLRLNEDVEFTDFIRPACLWDSDINQEAIYGKTGVVVGWGREESGLSISSEPKMIKVPIVSTMTCRGTNPTFFKITSNTTFCAGSREGAGPCNGDSGSGLYMKVNSRWYIRGIVSNSLKNENNECNVNEYTVYTDCAMYLPWISAMYQ